MANILCLVCGNPTKNANLGVDVCRACSNFFKRSCVSSRLYACRQGTNKCMTRRDMHLLCRRCRLDKCLAIGMIPPKEQEKSSKNQTEREEGGKDLRQLPCTPSTSNALFLSSPTSSTNGGHLARMGKEFEASFNRRRQKELELRATNRYGNATIKADDGTIFYVTTCDFMNDMYPSLVADQMQMFRRTFPEFASLTSKEQQFIMKSCLGSLVNMECNQRTVKHFPTTNRYCILGATGISDINDTDTFFGGIKNKTEDFNRAVRYYMNRSNMITWPMVREAAITETEFHAAACLIIWNFNLTLSPMPEHLVDIGNRITATVYGELSKYYKNELRCTNMAIRLGRLMLYVHTMQEAATMLQEEFQTYRLIGAFNENDLWQRIFL